MHKEIQNNSENLLVLIIEDNQGDFVLIEDHLLDKFKNIKIIHCDNYATAVIYLKHPKEKPDVILLDLHLPDLAGIVLINGILGLAFQVPVIILSGYSDLALAKNSLQLGVSDYLLKDEIDPSILHKTIVFAINRSEYINQIENEKLNYENLFEFNPQPTWLLDYKSLSIINANIAAQKKYGFSLVEFLKMPFTQLHPNDEKQLVKHKLLSNGEKNPTNQFTHILSDGKTVKVEIYFREIKNNSMRELIVQSNDISEILNHIDTIEIQNTKLRDIAWTQSHLVRAPLARILGIINLLELETPKPEELLFFLSQLKVSGNEMDDIIKKIVNQTQQIEIQ